MYALYFAFNFKLRPSNLAKRIAAASRVAAPEKAETLSVSASTPSDDSKDKERGTLASSLDDVKSVMTKERDTAEVIVELERVESEAEEVKSQLELAERMAGSWGAHMPHGISPLRVRV